jgi:hypothetical protein
MPRNYAKSQITCLENMFASLEYTYPRVCLLNSEVAISLSSSWNTVNGILHSHRGEDLISYIVFLYGEGTH